MTLWTVARQAPLSVGFTRQEYWSELPFPSPGDLPDPRIELVISYTGRLFTIESPQKPLRVDSGRSILHYLSEGLIMTVIRKIANLREFRK